ncbi:MAG: serine/threonine-protein kinase, partial [Verrucomicrobiota bacterium]
GLLAGYEVLEEIARGGMGVVLKALDPGLQRYVAIKVLAPELAAFPESRQRFLREARSAAAVDHENILPIHRVGEENGFPFIVMPLVEGESLLARIKRIGPLPYDDLVRIAIRAARGLAAAHAKGVMHRDIKPDNILLESDSDRVWLADFGLARVAEDEGITRTGVMAGTPQYFSPEQALGEQVDVRSDLFSFGSLLYTMAIGHPPFKAPKLIAVVRKVVDEEPERPSSLRPDMPPGLEVLILELMNKDPAGRPGAEELIERLSSVGSGHYESS